MNKKLKILISTLVFALLTGSLITGFYYFQKYQQTKNPQAAADKEIKMMVARVGKLMVLPQDETPTLATIYDKEKLQNQPFFAQAKNGDKILIYTKNQKAILYDPKANKILEVSSLNIEIATPTPLPAAENQYRPVKVALYNSTNTAGLTKKAEQLLVESNFNTEVIFRGNSRGSYPKTLLINFNGQENEIITKLQELFAAEKADLPAQEEEPPAQDGQKAEVLLILGQDYADSFLNQN